MGEDRIFEGLKLEAGETKRIISLFFGDVISFLPFIVYATTQKYISLFSFLSKVEETS